MLDGGFDETVHNVIYSRHTGRAPIIKEGDGDMPGSQLNVVLFFQTLGKIIGNRHNCDVELASITHKDTGEVIYSRPKNEIKGGRRIV